nr:MAG TPA: hypothetical protein [Caudoviricetes sp.]
MVMGGRLCYWYPRPCVGVPLSNVGVPIPFAWWARWMAGCGVCCDARCFGTGPAPRVVPLPLRIVLFLLCCLALFLSCVLQCSCGGWMVVVFVVGLPLLCAVCFSACCLLWCAHCLMV